jgi:DNA gyrase/topoisomerase IV subunit A
MKDDREINKMWSGKISKQQYIERIARQVLDRSRRRLRGTDEQEYLRRDLEAIEEETNLLLEILANPKDVYTEFEIETAQLERFKNDLAAANKKPIP